MDRSSTVSLLAGDDDHPADDHNHSNSHGGALTSTTIASLMRMRDGLLQEGFADHTNEAAAYHYDDDYSYYCNMIEPLQDQNNSASAAPLLLQPPKRTYKPNNNAPKPRSGTEQIMDNIVMVAVLLAWLLVAICLAWHHHHYGTHAQ